MTSIKALEVEVRRLWQIAKDADADYSAMLSHKHGRDAGDVRYRHDEQDAVTRRLGEAYVAASSEWQAMQTHLTNVKAEAARAARAAGEAR